MRRHHSTNDIEQLCELEWNTLASGLPVVLRSALSPLLPWSRPRLASLPLFDESKSAALVEYTPEVKIAVQTGLGRDPFGMLPHCAVKPMIEGDSLALNEIKVTTSFGCWRCHRCRAVSWHNIILRVAGLPHGNYLSCFGYPGEYVRWITSLPFGMLFSTLLRP